MLTVFSSSVFASKLNQLTTEDEEEISKVIKGMSIEEKIGQMMMVGFSEKEDIKELIEKYHIGNVILFERNIKYQREEGVKVDDERIAPAVTKLSNDLQGFASNTEKQIPLLIAVDQEGGNTIIIEKGVTLLPSNMVIGATRSEEYAFQAGRITGEELRAMGIHMNLAPVVDINQNIKDDVIGVRSYGGDTELVSKLGLQYTNGLHEGGVLSVAKHFPGHGDSPVDPHFRLPKVLYSYEVLKKGNLKPFEVLVKNGVDAVMTAHMDFSSAFDKVPEGLPASLSPEILKGELREKMGFEGIIISDDMEMRAVLMENGDEARTIGKAAIQAVKATTDIIIVATHVDKAKEVYNALIEEFKDKRFQEKFIDLAVRRILRLKKKVNKSLNISDWIVNSEKVKEIVMKEENLEIAHEIVKEAITLVIDNNDLFSGKSFPFKKVFSTDEILVVSPYYKEETFTTKIKEKNRGDITSIDVRYYPSWDSKRNEEEVTKKMEEILEKVINAKMVIVGITREQHITIVENLVNKTEKPIIVIAFSEPYLLGEELIRRKNITYLAAYSHLEPSIVAIVDVLFGKVKPKPAKYLPVLLYGITTETPSKIAPVIPRSSAESLSVLPSIEPQETSDSNSWWFYILGGLGAFVGGFIKLVQVGIRNIFPKRDESGILQLGLVLNLCINIVWGIILCLVVVIINSFHPILQVVRENLIGAFVIGFIGGYLGSAILNLIPGIGRVSK